MLSLKKTLLFLASLFVMISFANRVSAAVYVCQTSGTKCNAWAAITATERALKSTDTNTTTIDAALRNSSSNYIKDAYSSRNNLNLYLKRDLWHPASHNPQHLTAYIYDANDLHTRLWSCHISSRLSAGTYYTTCHKKSQ